MTLIVNRSRGTFLARKARTTRGHQTALPGGRGVGWWRAADGLLLPGTMGLHSHAMPSPIDLVFFDGDMVVVGVVYGLAPSQRSPYFISAAGALEVLEGVVEASDTRPGDVLATIEYHAAPARAMGEGAQGRIDRSRATS